MIDLGPTLRAVLVGASSVTSNLTAYESSYPVFTRRPVPTDAPMPQIVISPDVILADEDLINQQIPYAVRDIAVYGRNDTHANYVKVQTIAYAIRDLFHRAPRFTLTPSGWNVIDVTAAGPFPAPTDDEKLVARIVSVKVRLTPAA